MWNQNNSSAHYLIVNADAKLMLQTKLTSTSFNLQDLWYKALDCKQFQGWETRITITVTVATITAISVCLLLTMVIIIFPIMITGIFGQDEKMKAESQYSRCSR